SVGGRAPATLTAQSADGVVSIEPDGSWGLWLTLPNATVEAGPRIVVGSTHATLPVPPAGRAGPIGALAVNASRVKLPAGIGPLGDVVDKLDFEAALKGSVPNGKLVEAVAAWRDAGGTIELDKLHFKWGALAATGAGTISLDQELQPIGGLSGSVQGYDQILT